MMFADWLVKGAEIGFTAFFAVIAFIACVMVVLGIAGMIGSFIKAGGGGDDLPGN